MSFYDEPVFQPGNFKRAIEAQVPRKFIRDQLNWLRFGKQAPKSDECIFICPADVTRIYARHKGAAFRPRHSGIVRGGDWDLHTNPLSENRKHKACRAHFENGVPWTETGITKTMMDRVEKNGIFDGCRSFQDILKRYSRMDEMFDALQVSRFLQPMTERSEYFRREHGGVFVHIDRHGLPILAGNGNHRMAMAQILELDWMPALLGVIHADALHAGVLERLRKRPTL